MQGASALHKLGTSRPIPVETASTSSPPGNEEPASPGSSLLFNRATLSRYAVRLKMMLVYWNTFAELIRTPFTEAVLVWGIVPLYFALLLNELNSGKANFRTALQTGFSFVWASAQWLYPYFRPQGHGGPHFEFNAMLPVNLFVTFLVLALGIVALVCGARRKFPKYLVFLGHTRFSNYFMITIFPMQAHYLPWTWNAVAAIGIFAVPVWMVLHFGLMPFRR
jgi:hypothetical protein